MVGILKYKNQQQNKKTAQRMATAPMTPRSSKMQNERATFLLRLSNKQNILVRTMTWWRCPTILSRLLLCTQAVTFFCTTSNKVYLESVYSSCWSSTSYVLSYALSFACGRPAVVQYSVLFCVEFQWVKSSWSFLRFPFPEIISRKIKNTQSVGSLSGCSPRSNAVPVT